MKQIETLVEDIYGVASGKSPIPVDQDAIETYIQEAIKEFEMHLRKFVGDRQVGLTSEPFRLRPSNIGLPLRRLYLDKKASENLDSQVQFGRKYQHISFMFGNLCETWILFLSKLSGHSVTNQQQTVTLGGLSGSKDCDIDGVVVDVKSASPFSFSKVKQGSLNNTNPSDDPWGYRDQLTFYLKGETL